MKILLSLALLFSLEALAIKPAPAVPPATAIFSGGCFWSMEKAFESAPGVKEAVSGYSGGTKPNPTYEDVNTGTTGHFESVKVTYDPKRVTYKELLETYWHKIDPVDPRGQFCDKGEEYKAVIWYANAEEKKLAEESLAEVLKLPTLKGEKITTQIKAAAIFYPAEDYHQDFAKNDPERYEKYRIGCGRDKRSTEIWGNKK
ncbi:MAG: peptide-methionine (S)-S-oxide reductase MsrA [Bdellovibrionota bacterium]